MWKFIKYPLLYTIIQQWDFNSNNMDDMIDIPNDPRAPPTPPVCHKQHWGPCSNDSDLVNSCSNMVYSDLVNSKAIPPNI